MLRLQEDNRSASLPRLSICDQRDTGYTNSHETRRLLQQMCFRDCVAGKRHKRRIRAVGPALGTNLDNQGNREERAWRREEPRHRRTAPLAKCNGILPGA